MALLLAGITAMAVVAVQAYGATRSHGIPTNDADLDALVDVLERLWTSPGLMDTGFRLPSV